MQVIDWSKYCIFGTTLAEVGGPFIQFAGYTGPGCGAGDFANDPSHYFIGSNGQFKLVEVPEPAPLALFGIALLGIAAVRRQRA